MGRSRRVRRRFRPELVELGIRWAVDYWWSACGDSANRRSPESGTTRVPPDPRDVLAIVGKAEEQDFSPRERECRRICGAEVRPVEPALEVEF